MTAATLVGCAGLSTDHTPVFHTPLADTLYAPDSASSDPHRNELSDIRDKARRFADNLLKSRKQTGDFGESDVGTMLTKLGVGTPWQAKDGLAALARETRRQRAYAADGRPLPGDIVLFHNQRDLNQNGEIDDWLTGCGIVIASDRGRFEAVVRTGHAPRRVVVTPLTPSIREENGNIINSFARVPSRYDPSGTEYLAGQLYAGHIDLEKLPLR